MPGAILLRFIERSRKDLSRPSASILTEAGTTFILLCPSTYVASAR